MGNKKGVGFFTKGHTICVRHGMSETPTWNAWKNMRKRCNSTSTWHGWYAERGIVVCDRWLKFDNFLADMGPKPIATSLDRINNDGNYEPANCRWATQRQQSSNKRSNRNIELNGIKQPISEWCYLLDIPYHTVIGRLNKLGWSDRDAICTPPRRFKRLQALSQ